MENKTEFKVGDIVEAFGCRGVVTALCGEERVRVKFDPNRFEEYSFLADGRLHDWSKHHSLKLIKRPKQKKKVMMYLAVFLDTTRPDNEHYFISERLFESEAEASKYESTLRPFIALAENLGVEIEVDV